jgi:Tfp pilus assembly protein PilF
LKIDKMRLLLFFIFILPFHVLIAQDHLVLTKRGVEAIKAGKADSAQWYFEQAIQADSTYYKAYFNLGLLYEGLEQETEAIDYFEKVIALEPNNEKAYRHIAVLTYQQGQLEEAARHFTALTQISPENPNYHNFLGTVLMHQEKYEASIAYYDTAQAHGLQDAMMYYHRGFCFVKLGKPNQAQEDLRRAIQLDNTLARAHTELGIILVNNGETEEACSHFEQAKANGGESEALMDLSQKHCE